MKNPNIPAPKGPNFKKASPNATNAPNTTGHTKKKTGDSISIVVAVNIGTNLLPLKNAKVIGNCVLWNLLKISDAIIPDAIPINALFILPKATGTFSTSTFVNIATESFDNNVVITKKPTNPANAAEPSFSLDIPTAIPTANNIGILSSMEAPDFIRKAAAELFAPHPAGSSLYPIPKSNAAAGITAIGNISDLPIFCKYFIIFNQLSFYFFHSYPFHT